MRSAAASKSSTPRSTGCAPGRRGIVVVDWSRAAYLLRDCVRITVPEELVIPFGRHVKASSPESSSVPKIIEADMDAECILWHAHELKNRPFSWRSRGTRRCGS